jgi:hypothetical protein
VTLPDVPRWVEAHGILGDPAHWRQPLGAGFALGHDAAKLVVIAGEADPAMVTALARSHPDHTLLFAVDDLCAAIDRPVERAILHTLPDPAALPDLDGAFPLPANAQLPPALAGELAWARTRGPIWTAYVDGEPASFAYAPWRSALYFDVSVDTLAGSRQLGLATIVAAAMIRDERSRGREPVWGADEGNGASLRLAKRLGFEPVDEIWVAPCAR